MEANIRNRNKKVKETAKKRRDALIDILNEEQLETFEEFIIPLRKRDLIASVSTIRRDLKAINASKQEGSYYKLDESAKKNQYIEKLNDISNEFLIATDVKIFFIKTEEGYAQQVAYYLENIYSDKILKTVVDLDTILLFVDNEEVDEGFNKFVYGEEEQWMLLIIHNRYKYSSIFASLLLCYFYNKLKRVVHHLSHHVPQQ